MSLSTCRLATKDRSPQVSPAHPVSPLRFTSWASHLLPPWIGGSAESQWREGRNSPFVFSLLGKGVEIILPYGNLRSGECSPLLQQQCFGISSKTPRICLQLSQVVRFKAGPQQDNRAQNSGGNDGPHCIYPRTQEQTGSPGTRVLSLDSRSRHRRCPPTTGFGGPGTPGSR